MNSKVNKARPTFSASERQFLRTALYEWYSQEHRKLPWRRTPGSANRPDPYAVWVSEVMLQQTQVATVVEYFRRWMAEFPTLQHLARSDLERVNELWSGLGYYRRARMLHSGAQFVVNEHDGTIPGGVDDLLKIPGIGKYTAGAIASIAFGRRVGAVDGNVVRVFSRLKAVDVEPSSGEASKIHWGLAADLAQDIEDTAPDIYPGDLNQALMELGATICTPRKPLCGDDCPVSKHCRVYRTAVAAGEDPCEAALQYPPKKRPTKQRNERLAVFILSRKSENNECFLMTKRPSSGLLAGMWEFPSLVVDDDSSEASCQDAVSVFLKETIGVPSSVKVHDAQRIGEVEHIFSHIRQRIFVDALKVNSTVSLAETQVTHRWVYEEDIVDMALPTQMRKVFDLYLGSRNFTSSKRGQKRPLSRKRPSRTLDAYYRES